MKNLLILLMIFISGLNADNTLNIYEAFQKAKETNRPVYYIVTSASCEHCYKHLKNTIIPNNELIRKDFILAISDLSKGDKIPSDFPFDGYTPTAYIIAPSGELMISPLKGNFDENFLHQTLQKIYRAYGN